MSWECRRPRRTVVTLPARHAYVDAVVPQCWRHVTQTPSVHDSSARGVFSPDPMWAGGGIRRLPDDVRIVHVHFGFDHRSPRELEAWASELAQSERSMVMTVHDLRNPHHRTGGLLKQQLNVLLPAAASVITLTRGAARELLSTFDVTATVIAHPRVFVTRTAPTRVGLVGIHLKSLRRNVVEPDEAVAAVARAVASAGGSLEVLAHRDVSDPQEIRAVAGVVSRFPAARLRLIDRLSDAHLQRWLSTLQVGVMINRFGTHSGWLEACRDVGTTVVAPTCGYYDSQWSDLVMYRNTEAAGLDAESLEAAVVLALSQPPTRAVDQQWRRQQLETIRTRHHAIYQAVL